MFAGQQSQDGLENRFFAEWFRPDWASIRELWWDFYDSEPRVMALLFAAILAEEEFS
jgi:hypothetical protein